MPPKSPPRAVGPAASASTASTSRPKLGKRNPDHLGHRLIANGVEGWGKTSLVAYANNPAIIMVGGETGYDTLLSAGRVPSVDAVKVTTWQDLLAVVDDVAGAGYGVLGIDAMGGAERLCHELVCARDFKNDWGERGFGSFQKGYDVSVTEWLNLLAKLDKVRESGTNIVMLSHSKVQTFKNPMGADYDKYVADCHAKTWSVTHKWADAVLFCTFVSIVDKAKPTDRKGKGIGNNERTIYTEHRDAFDAKNRFGMPESIDMPADPSQMWDAIWQYIDKKEVQP
jgi:hypothetical protein